MRSEPQTPLILPRVLLLSGTASDLTATGLLSEVVARILGSAITSLGLIGCATCGPETGGLGCVECVVTLVDLVLNAFGLGVLDTIIADILSFFGLDGRPREAATEQIGTLLQNSTNWRIWQLGRGIVAGASMVGRVVSSGKDATQWFSPAMSQTMEYLLGPINTWDAKAKYLNELLFNIVYGGGPSYQAVKAWDQVYSEWKGPTKLVGLTNDCRDLVPQDTYHKGQLCPRRAALPISTLITQFDTLSKPIVARQPHASFDDVLNVVVVLQAEKYNYNLRWIWIQDHDHYAELLKWWTDHGHTNGGNGGTVPTKLPNPPPPPPKDAPPAEWCCYYESVYLYFIALADTTNSPIIAASLRDSATCICNYLAIIAVKLTSGGAADFTPIVEVLNRIEADLRGPADRKTPDQVQTQYQSLVRYYVNAGILDAGVAQTLLS